MNRAYILNPGVAEGHLSFVSTGRVLGSDILAFHPEIQKELDEIQKKGWKYLFIETMATTKAEMTIEKSKFQIKSDYVKPDYGIMPKNAGRQLELMIGVELPKITSIPEIQMFKVNVCSKSFPRAATIDLSKNVVTYLHDPFWKWEAGSEVDEQKLSDAKEVYEIATWLIDEKKFKLVEEVTEERYSELSYRFKKILGTK
jgi:hypothetical protein